MRHKFAHLAILARVFLLLSSEAVNIGVEHAEVSRDQNGAVNLAVGTVERARRRHPQR